MSWAAPITPLPASQQLAVAPQQQATPQASRAVLMFDTQAGPAEQAEY